MALQHINLYTIQPIAMKSGNFKVPKLCCCKTITKDVLDYYDNLVTQGKADALSYKLPTNAREYYSKNYNTRGKYSGIYDYIVIGAGSAGAVVANRLSEIKNAQTLLLEAGGDENDFVDIPGMTFYAQQTKYNWGYVTVPQTSACLGMVDNICPYPRGKGFGGTTIINGLVYARGDKGDFDRWEADGNKGWSYNDVLPYFLKSENASFPGADPGYYSQSGPLHVEQSSYESVQLEAFLKANNELGYSTLDYNGQNEIGVSKAQFNSLNGRRFSSADGFLTPQIRKRKNLVLSSNSFVTKILINNTTKIAYGVVYMRNGHRYTVFAKKEIVLSAGAFGSPQILMLSGVGPKTHLETYNISVVADLPVGNNLRDHPNFSGLNIVSNVSLPFNTQREYLKEYLEGTGLYTLPGNNEGVGFYKVNNSMKGIPDYEFMFIPPNRTSAITQTTNLYTNETYNTLFAGINPTNTFNVYIIALESKSQGTLRLKSSSPFEYPLIDPNFLGDQEDHDINVIYDAVEYLIRLLDTDAFKRINARIVEAILPACKNTTYLSKAYWICTIRHLTKSINHPIGTCKMGPDSKTSVVDNKLRVHGIQNLRVADGSIMPDTIAGHPNAPITMFGERVADFIKFG